jgi:hypothetical protein
MIFEPGTGALRFDSPSFGLCRCDPCGEMTDHNTAWHRQHGVPIRDAAWYAAWRPIPLSELEGPS